jgi:hypothetical protein
MTIFGMPPDDPADGLSMIEDAIVDDADQQESIDDERARILRERDETSAPE